MSGRDDYTWRMKIHGLLHATVLVTDLDRARQFYGGVLGLTEKARRDLDFAGTWYELGECELHLMVTSAPLPCAAERPRRDYHVALLIDDYQAARQALDNAGLPYRPSSRGLLQLFVRDPDGNLIELQQKIS